MTSRIGGIAKLKLLCLSPTPTAPANFGNRIRILTVLEHFEERGFDIDFMYYPSEGDWRYSIPAEAQHQMQKRWKRFFVVPPLRELHTPALADDHTIDEWWDDSIGRYLEWVFSKVRYDIFIVNYTWLSKALEYAPPGTLKVLDTHDRFSERRHLLASAGISAEFFHTTTAEELKGLRRADLVLSIKEQEEKYFRSHGIENVVTLIHADHERKVTSSVSSKLMVFGVFAARNNLNVVNLRKFIGIAAPIFKSYLCPLELRIYGSVCVELADLEASYPFVKVMGYVDKQEDFYSSVDCVLVPMETSTGLKIKAAEALSYGLPVISHAHAFEGLPVSHEFQSLPSFESMADAVIRYCFDDDLRKELAEATRHSHHHALGKFRSSIDAIIDKRFEVLPSSVYIVDSAMVSDQAQIDSISSLMRFVGYKTPIGAVVVSGGGLFQALVSRFEADGIYVVSGDRLDLRFKGGFPKRWIDGCRGHVFSNSVWLLEIVRGKPRSLVLDTRGQHAEQGFLVAAVPELQLFHIDDIPVLGARRVVNSSTGLLADRAIVPRIFLKHGAAEGEPPVNLARLRSPSGLLMHGRLSRFKMEQSVSNNAGWAKLWRWL